MNDHFYMSLAINEAWKYQIITYPNPPVGSLILDKNNNILSIEAHKKSSQNHAEVEAILKAYIKVTGDNTILNIDDKNYLHEYLYENHNNIFNGATIYTTLEPCNHYGKTPPCSKLISKLNFKRVVSSVSENSDLAMGGEEYIKNSSILYTPNIMCKSGAELLYPYFKWKNSGNFNLFKCAITLNRVYEGKISDKKFLTYTHRIREVSNSLIIGGNTVKTDRPTLDARLVKGKAPNIKIYSKSKNIDNTIPLFKVKKREVTVIKDIKENIGLNLIEGTNTLLDNLFDDIDYILIAINKKKVIGKKLAKIYKFKLVYKSIMGKDLICWFKRK